MSITTMRTNSHLARPGWRPLLLAIGVALSLSALPWPTTLAHVCAPDPQLGSGISGTLLMPSASGIGQMTLPDRVSRALPIQPGSGVVTGVARSRDGAWLAVARFSRPPSEIVGGADILITGPEGGASARSVLRERPGELLGSPTWLPGGGLVFERQDITTQVSGSRVERVEADGSGRRLVAEGAAFPTVTSDGSRIAYVRGQIGEQLIGRAFEGGLEQVLVQDPRFLAVAFPRFSPDGQWIAFAAASEVSAVTWELDKKTAALLLPGARVATAHGVPWDIWAVRSDGSGLRRVTTFYDDDASPAWSPDGQWLLVFGGESVKIVAADGSQAYCLLSSGGYGWADWF